MSLFVNSHIIDGIKNPANGGENMKKNHKNNGREKNKTSRILIRVLCWGVVPVLAAVLLVLDGMGIYVFNEDRLIVLGAATLLLLLPFFGEVRLKDILIKRDDT